MVDPLIRLDTDRASVQPGGQARFTVTMTNPGTLVEGYWLQVLGPAAAWAEVVPPEVSVYPQQEATAAVVLSPPSGPEAPSGVLPFGVIARSTVDADVSAVAEGDIEIGAVYGLEAKIIPVTSSGVWRGRHVIQLSNWGNAHAQLRMTASDPDQALGFYLSPEYVDLPPGAHATVRLSARTRHPFLRGTPVRLPFQVAGERLDAEEGPRSPGQGYGDPSRPVVDAALNQRPIISRALITLLVAVVLAVAGLIIYIAVRPPTPEEALASRGSPPRPQLRVEPVGPDSVKVSWDKVDLAERYNLQRVDPANDSSVTQVNQLDGALSSTTVTGLPADADTCFRMSVTRGGLTGPVSDKACARTAPAPPSPSPTPPPPPPTEPSAAPSTAAPSPPPPPPPPPPTSAPTPSVTPGDPNTDPLMKQAWIAVAEVIPRADNPEERAKAVAEQLTTAGLDGRYLDSARYPRLRLADASTPAPVPPTPLPTPLPESWVVYLGPFPTQVDAENRCPDIAAVTGTTSCVAGQPDPPP